MLGTVLDPGDTAVKSRSIAVIGFMLKWMKKAIKNGYMLKSVKCYHEMQSKAKE